MDGTRVSHIFSREGANNQMYALVFIDQKSREGEDSLGSPLIFRILIKEIK